MSNYAAGQHAETRAAKFLAEQGFKIRQLNWKTRYCEIDIVAEKAGTVYFVEVKYRRTSKYGYASDYVTPKKLQQMQFSAEIWVHDTNWNGQCQLAVIAIDGNHLLLIDTLFL